MGVKAKATGAALTAAEATPEGRAATVAASAAGKAKGGKAPAGSGSGSSTGKGGGAGPAKGKGAGSSSSSSSTSKGKKGGWAAGFVMSRKALLAEFVLCLLLLGLSGITGTVTGDSGTEQTGSRLAIKGSALAGVFVVLGLVAAGGKSAQKAAGALGCVITLAYVFQERATFTAVAKWAGTQAKEPKS